MTFKPAFTKKTTVMDHAQNTSDILADACKRLSELRKMSQEKYFAENGPAKMQGVIRDLERLGLEHDTFFAGVQCVFLGMTKTRTRLLG